MPDVGAAFMYSLTFVYYEQVCVRVWSYVMNVVAVIVVLRLNS